MNVEQLSSSDLAGEICNLVPLKKRPIAVTLMEHLYISIAQEILEQPEESENANANTSGVSP